MAANVYYLDLWGTREEKYEWLRTHTLADLRSIPSADLAARHPCRGGRCPCRRACGDVFTGRRTFRQACRKKKRHTDLRDTPAAEAGLTPPLFGPLNPDLFPSAVPVPSGVYQGLCRVILQIEMLLGLSHCANASLAVQVADTLHLDAAAAWIRDHPAEFSRGCGAGFQAI